MWEHLIPALIDLIEGTLLLCSKVDSDLGLSDATYRILSCLITRRFPTRLYPIVLVLENVPGVLYLEDVPAVLILEGVPGVVVLEDVHSVVVLEESRP